MNGARTDELQEARSGDDDAQSVLVSGNDENGLPPGMPGKRERLPEARELPAA
jgi:hypothetical protein